MDITEQVDISAPIERVWDLTVDVERWPQLMPTVTSVELVGERGPLVVGRSARIKQPAQPRRTWTVTACERPSRFAWATRSMGVEMVGRHDLAELPTGGTRNMLTIELHGRGAGILGRLLGRSIRRTLRIENESFRAAAESPVLT